MRPYLLVTATIFALVALAHLWRIAYENRALGRDPWFIGLTVLCVALSAWAFRLARRTSRGA